MFKKYLTSHLKENPVRKAGRLTQESSSPEKNLKGCKTLSITLPENTKRSGIAGCE
jgi:hypothetical protein